MGRNLIGFTVVVGAAAVVLAVALVRNGDASRDDVADATVKAADNFDADPAAVKRGAYVAIAADCAACHDAPGSAEQFAGGYDLRTPFGTIVSSNITPDRETGIGNWTERDFFRAVRHGKSPTGLLYAAMPYNAYVKMTDGDMHDLWTYMRTVKPVNRRVVSDQLPFPFNVRLVNLGWNLLFFDNRPYVTDPAQSPAWNRGRYLVDGLEHCGACHTPKNLLGGDRGGAYLQGGTLQGWYAPEIAGNAHVGLGSWSTDDITAYLRDGSNRASVASGPMAEAVENSTQHLVADDLQAIAGYLKSVPGSTGTAPVALGATDPLMVRGRKVFDINCSACHASTGQGVQGMVTGFAGNPGTQSPAVGSLLNSVLNGGRAAATASNPTGAGMPSFAWKLGDDDVAAVLTFVRNSWGNAAAPVTGEAVRAMRESTGNRGVVAPG
jgi:mono/diheme cytochrome c family protein